MAERIVIEGNQAHIYNGQPDPIVLPLEVFVRNVANYTLQGVEPDPRPDNSAWLARCGAAALAIVDLKPELRWINWIAADSPASYGPNVKTTERRLATPYVVLSIPFRDGRVMPRVQVFYRNEPLRGLDGEGGTLYWPNLLNVSPNAYGCTAWFCTQYLPVREIPLGIAAGISEVVHHLWGGSFNRSSEEHEGKSTFSKAVEESVDPRVTDVDRWEAESAKDPRFVLSVNWKSTGITVGQLINSEMRVLQVKPAPTTAQELVTISLRSQKGT